MLLVFISIVVWFYSREPLFVYRYQRNTLSFHFSAVSGWYLAMT